MVFALLWVAASARAADCFEHHAARFGLDPALLRAIAWVESGGRPGAINDSHAPRTGSRDIGLMQINSRWLPKLAARGIAEQDLLRPCTSIEIAAWLLHDLVRRYGNSWDAVGAYNAACTSLAARECAAARGRYAWKVYGRLQCSEPVTSPTDSGPRRPFRQQLAPSDRSAGLVSVAATASAESPVLSALEPRTQERQGPHELQERQELQQRGEHS